MKPFLFVFIVILFVATIIATTLGIVGFNLSNYSLITCCRYMFVAILSGTLGLFVGTYTEK